MTTSKLSSTMRALVASVRRHPGVEEGIACAGTSIESRTLKVCGKAFAFVRPGNLMLKLSDSLGAAKAMAARAPERIKVGASGWHEGGPRQGPRDGAAEAAEQEASAAAVTGRCTAGSRPTQAGATAGR